jgi:hypothetical protein
MRIARPVVMVLCVALAGYAAITVLAGNPSWLGMLVWFTAVVVVHDGILLPAYSITDRGWLAVVPRTRVPLVNHVRIPALGAGLTLLIYLPGIIRQGGVTFTAATGLDQQPYLLRWLLLVVIMFGISALVYAVRVARPAAPDDPGSLPTRGA